MEIIFCIYFNLNLPIAVYAPGDYITHTNPAQPTCLAYRIYLFSCSSVNPVVECFGTCTRCVAACYGWYLVTAFCDCVSLYCREEVKWSEFTTSELSTTTGRKRNRVLSSSESVVRDKRATSRFLITANLGGKANQQEEDNNSDEMLAWFQEDATTLASIAFAIFLFCWSGTINNAK